MYDVALNENRELYSRIMESKELNSKINILETYFLKQLKKNENQLKKASIVKAINQQILLEPQQLNLPALAKQSGLSERYIQKLYVSNFGISPIAFNSVVRFNKSLQLVLNTTQSLTEITYDCGYYDQAHFIKEFRKFTGITPSSSRSSLVKNDTDFQQAVNIGF
jgi:AraC-like DNA-binding protein